MATGVFESLAAGRQLSVIPAAGRVRIAVAAAILFVLYMGSYLAFWPRTPVTTGDSRGYMAMAQDLSDFRLDSPTIRTPGYPLLLLLTGAAQRPNRALMIVSLTLHFLAVGLLLALLHRFGLGFKSLLWLAMLLLLPPFTQSAGFVLTESLAEFFLAITFVATVAGLGTNRLSYLMAGSIGACAAALVRPTYQFLPLVIPATAWIVLFLSRRSRVYSKQCLRATVCLIAAASLLLGGYSFYVYKRFGYFGLTYAAGINLSDKTARFVERLPSQYEPLRSLLIKYRDESLISGQSHSAEQYVWNHWTDLKAAMNKDDVPLAKQLTKANIRLIASNPINYLDSVGSALVTLLFPYTTPLATRGSIALQALWTALHFMIIGLFFLQLWVVVGCEIFAQSVRIQPAEWSGGQAPARETHFEFWIAYYLSVCFVAYTLLMSAGADTGNARFRSPVDILLILNTVLGFWLWRNSVKSRVSAISSEAVEQMLPVR